MPETSVAERISEYTKGEHEAWRDYLRVCRSCSAANYDEVEAWAWARLISALPSLARRATS